MFLAVFYWNRTQNNWWHHLVPTVDRNLLTFNTGWKVTTKEVDLQTGTDITSFQIQPINLLKKPTLEALIYKNTVNLVQTQLICSLGVINWRRQLLYYLKGFPFMHMYCMVVLLHIRIQELHALRESHFKGALDYQNFILIIFLISKLLFNLYQPFKTMNYKKINN